MTIQRFNFVLLPDPFSIDFTTFNPLHRPYPNQITNSHSAVFVSLKFLTVQIFTTKGKIMVIIPKWTVLSRSYCHAVWPAIVIIILTVHLSVCLRRSAFWLN